MPAARIGVVVITGCALGVLAVSAVVGKVPLLIWNSTASVPRGLYIVSHAKAVRTGDLVAAWLPTSARELAAERHYIPATVPVLKPVIAADGDTICATETTVFVNGASVATRRPADRAGRVLPAWTGCQHLTAEDVFLVATRSADSFDGRYFGSLARRNIIAVVRPLWTY